MKLVIISHTKHYKNPDGTVVGWGPTISEINHLANHFEMVYHIAVLYPGSAPASSLPYLRTNIEFVALPPTGGASIIKKTSILWNLFSTISIVKKTLKKVDAFQLRTPTGIGIYLIPYLTYFSKKKGWFKYAGNWNQSNAPLGYHLQRRMLKRQGRTVTINGTWENQPEHCLTFENPCLTNEERREGIDVIKNKKYDGKFSFCFVGRLDNAKGVMRILDAFEKVNKNKVSVLHFVGDGSAREDYKKQTILKDVPAVFHGFLSRDKVFEIYRECHFLLLPSTASEGFPKVIAEGMNFGCIPIVSNVSSIGQYITSTNGFVMSSTNAEILRKILKSVFISKPSLLMNKATCGYVTASKFTFEYYNQRIIKEIL